MADFLTHILLSDDVMDKIESRRIYEGVAKKRTLFRLGAQGPDPLFFYNCFPGNGKGQLRELAHTMHGQSTGAFLKLGFEQLKDVSWNDGWIELAVYLAGFICHFTLDRMIHPYVNWAEKRWIWAMDGTPVQTTHMKVEVSLDVLLWKEIRGVPAHKVRTRKLIDIGKQWPISIQDFLLEAFKTIYDVGVDKKELSKVLTYFYRGHDLLYDPKGWKKRLINWLDSFTGGGIKPPKPPYPAKALETIDWANKKRRTWTNPFIDGEEHHESVEDILNKASFKASNLINTVFARILKHEPIDDLFFDISYITGLPCRET